MSSKNKKPRPIRITELIALNRTTSARELLKKYGMDDAVNHGDLEYKLSKLYSTTDDKKALEKEIAEMHPHKQLILDYCMPAITEAPKDQVVIEPVETKHGKLTVVDSGYSNAEGDCDCNNCKKQKHSNACGCGGYSSFNGFGGNMPQTGTSSEQHHFSNQIALVATIGLIGLFAVMIYKHKHA